MPAPKKRTPDEMLRELRHVAPAGPVDPSIAEPRKGRSKRGIDPAETSQICFRTEKDNHQKLRVWCMMQKPTLEIGEVMDELLTDFLADKKVPGFS